MFHELQETHVESLARHLKAWKKEGRNGEPMSEMTMFDEIVAAHYRIGAHLKTGIHFSDGKDEYNRQKANAIRIKRLLKDDEEEGIGREQADQLVNLLPSILAAMPAHLRISFLNEYLAPLDLHVSANESDEDGEIGLSGLTEQMHKDATAQQAYAEAMQNPNVLTLKAAQQAIYESEETKKKWRRRVGAMLKAAGTGGVAIAGAMVKKVLRKPTAVQQ